MLAHAALWQEGGCAPCPHTAIVAATEEPIPHHLERPHSIRVPCNQPQALSMCLYSHTITLAGLLMTVTRGLHLLLSAGRGQEMPTTA